MFLTDGSKSASWSAPYHLCNLHFRLLHDISLNKKSFLLRSTGGPEMLPKKKIKKKVCDPQKNFSRWCYLQEVLPKKKIKKKYVIHKKTLVGGALWYIFD
jgi:hypothetical protein